MQNFKILKNNEYASQLVNPHDIFENNFPGIPKNMKQLLKLYIYSSKCKILLVRSKNKKVGEGREGRKITKNFVQSWPTTTSPTEPDDTLWK